MNTKAFFSRTTVLAAVAVTVVAALPNLAQAATSPYFRQHQVTLGAGSGGTFEKDIFNTKSSGFAEEARTDPAIRLGYNFNLNERWAVGLVMHGYRHEFSEVVTTGNGPQTAEFTLNTYNRGLIVQHYFSRGRLQPYAYATVGLASGSAKLEMEGEEDSELEYDGFSFGGGGGALLVLAKYFGISVDGVMSLGGAEWEEQPFLNSSGKSFSPSYWAFTFNLVALIP
jgi:hypothetical protein